MGYKLIYFNVPGRAETSRFIFAQAGVKYEDYRVKGDEWMQLKPKIPTGSIPVLEVDGKQLTGSRVIERFLAERFNLAGSNDIENAEIAGIVDVVGDLGGKVEATFFDEKGLKENPDPKKFEEEDIPKYFGLLECFCKKNSSPKGYIYGKKPTYADFVVYNMIDFITPRVSSLNMKEKYPYLAKLKCAVEVLPNIAKWLKERPAPTSH